MQVDNLPAKLTEQHSVKLKPPKCHTKIGTVSFPAGSMNHGLNFPALCSFPKLTFIFPINRLGNAEIAGLDIDGRMCGHWAAN